MPLNNIQTPDTIAISQINHPCKSELKVIYLDGIRGIAAFLVIIHHFYLAFYPAYPLEKGNLLFIHQNFYERLFYRSPFLFLVNGRFLVLIFFILSGFVLSKKEHTERSTNDLKEATFRRFTRLYLPVAFSLSIAILLNRLSLNYSLEAERLTKSTFLLTLNSSLSIPTFLREILYSAMLTGNSSLNPVLWTISIELYGSFFVYAICAVTRGIKNRLPVLLIISGLMILTHNIEYSAFLLGMLLNYTNKIYIYHNAKKVIMIAVGIVLSLLLGGYTANTKGTFYELLPHVFTDYTLIINLVGAFSLVALIQHSKTTQKILSINAFSFLGNVSFSVYLIHILILSSFSSLFFLKINFYLNYNLAFMMTLLISILLIYGLSYLMTLFIDKKSVSASVFIYKSLFQA